MLTLPPAPEIALPVRMVTWPLLPFVVAPVDKYNQEMAILRAEMWTAAVVRQAEGMEHVDGKERERMKREMGAFLDLLADKPYIGLRKMRERRAGGL